MHLIPTQAEVVAVLRETGALRDGHFQYPTGLHSNEYLQVPLAMRYYQCQRTLSVGLSRLLRANSEIRAIVPQPAETETDKASATFSAKQVRLDSTLKRLQDPKATAAAPRTPSSLSFNNRSLNAAVALRLRVRPSA